MRRILTLSVAVLVVGAFAALAQDKTPGPKTEPTKPGTPHVKVVTVGELVVPQNEDVKVDDAQVLVPFEGRPKSPFYVVVKISRELPEKTPVVVRDLDIRLTCGATPPVDPTAVVVMKRDVEGGEARQYVGEARYPSADKKRWVSEVYYFPATPGQRDGVVTVGGQTVGRMLDWYATLIVRTADDVTARIALPDGTTPVIPGNQYRKIQFPAGTYPLVLEVRGKGKVEVPWTKFDRGDVKYLAVVGDIRNGPVLPADTLRKALPKINRAWQMFHMKRGVGGGAYNIATPAAPVHVNIDFGKDGVVGGLVRCEADRIEVAYVPDDVPPPKSGRKAPREGPRAVKVDEMYNNAWKVEPWEKAEFVEVSDDARKVVGQTSAGRFVFRSTESAPSLWSPDGLLDRGLLFERDYGTFRVDARKQGDLVVVWGVETK